MRSSNRNNFSWWKNVIWIRHACMQNASCLAAQTGSLERIISTALFHTSYVRCPCIYCSNMSYIIGYSDSLGDNKFLISNTCWFCLYITGLPALTKTSTKKPNLRYLMCILRHGRRGCSKKLRTYSLDGLTTHYRTHTIGNWETPVQPNYTSSSKLYTKSHDRNQEPRQELKTLEVQGHSVTHWATFVLWFFILKYNEFLADFSLFL